VRDPDPAAATHDFIINGLLPTTQADPDVFRALFRGFNLLDAQRPPDRPHVVSAAGAV
jgi:hypothetical protein